MRKRIIVIAAAACFAAVAVGVAVVASGGNDDTSPTSDEIRHNLVVDACGESNGPVTPVSDWKSATAATASGLEIQLDSGAVYLVIFHGNSVAENSEIYRVQCYSPEGGPPYRRATVAWADSGQTYELTDTPPVVDGAPSMQPSENAARPTPIPTGNASASTTLECGGALHVPSDGGASCGAASTAIAKCDVTHLDFVRSEHVGLQVWRGTRDGKEVIIYTATSIDFGVSVLSCARPVTNVDLPLFWKTVLQDNRTAFDMVPNADCAMNDSDLVLDEQPAGAKGVCSLWVSGEPHWYVGFTLVDTYPYFRLAERTRGP